MPKKIAIIALLVIAIIVVAGAITFIAQQQRKEGAEKVTRDEEQASEAVRSLQRIEESNYSIRCANSSKKKDFNIYRFARQLKEQFNVVVQVLEMGPPLLDVYTVDLETCQRVKEVIEAVGDFEKTRGSPCECKKLPKP